MSSSQLEPGKTTTPNFMGTNLSNFYLHLPCNVLKKVKAPSGKLEVQDKPDEHQVQALVKPALTGMQKIIRHQHAAGRYGK